MAAFLPDLPRLMPLAALCCAFAVLAAEPAALDIEAGSLQVDTAANRLLLRPVEIRQGAMSIRAEEAWVNGVEVNFSNTEWRFSGAVHITFEGGELDASEATAKFVANRLQNAHVTGAPATFAQPGTDGAPASRGRATTIDYDVPQSRVRLTGDVWFTDGRGEFATRAPLTYSLTDRSVSSERVQIRILPEAVPEALRKAQP
ncbi:MAG: LptA/OstA family protein [Steroidobacteraceae bacterium]